MNEAACKRPVLGYSPEIFHRPLHGPASVTSRTSAKATAQALAPAAAAPTLSDRVYSQLEEMLVTLQIQPGHVLSESELCARLNVSRTPVGEALQRLAREGLVHILPRRGIVVTEVNPVDHLKLLEVRREIARYSSRSAARRSKPAQREAMATIAGKLLAAAQADDSQALLQADKEFHDLFSQCIHNEYATRSLDALDSLSRRFYFVHHALDDAHKSAKLHADIAQAIAQGDTQAAEAASDALFDHLEQFTRATIEL